MKNGKKIILASVVILPLAIVVFLLYGVKAYLDEVPVITVRENLVFSANSEIGVQELAQIEKARTIRLRAQWADGSMAELETDNTKQILRVGNRTGECHVSICATGENAEMRDAEVTVRIE